MEKVDYLFINEKGQLINFWEKVSGVKKVELSGLFKKELDFLILI